MELNTGVILRDYRIVCLLGKGGMGEVYLAEETLLGRQLAIKRLNPVFTKDERFSERFINEARIQAKLIHPNIVALHNFFIEDGVYYMVMEYAAGNTLKELIAMTGPIPELRTLHIFKQLIGALGYAHSKQIIHRDIKPSNIMIDAHDNVKVMDFGIARLMSDKHLTRTGAKLGTLFYMSPEQVLTEKDIDHRTDIYSAGIVLYEMLTGKLPFNDSTDSDFVIMKEITENRTPDPREVYPHISTSLVNVMYELTAKDKSLRPPVTKVYSTLFTPQGDSGNGDGENNQICGVPVLTESLDRYAPIADNSLSTENPPDLSASVAEIQNEGVKNITPSRHRIKPLYAVLATLTTIAVVIAVFVFLTRHPKEIPGFVYVNGGTFEMGDEDFKNTVPVHSVTVSSFYICQHEVTQSEWESVMGNNPSYFSGSDLPVEKVSWNDAIDYCNKRSLKEGLKPCYSGSGTDATCDWTANGYRLPTEAEWEYAARGGELSRGYQYAGSDSLAIVGWFYQNSGDKMLQYWPAEVIFDEFDTFSSIVEENNCKTRAVMSKQPNELGIYDMSGNVAEWCWDWYDDGYYVRSPASDPRGADSGSKKVLRGGSYFMPESICHVAPRFPWDTGRSATVNGFRVVRAIF